VEFSQLWRRYRWETYSASETPGSGSCSYNYKDYCSIVLLTIVNAEYGFIHVDTGCNGRNSDGTVIENTTFYDKLKANMLNLTTTENKK
jgi:hypothetical protein